MSTEAGIVGILNVGAGDIKITFDKNNPADSIRAGRVVKDMLRRGYALLIEVEDGAGKHFVRAKDFDENTCEYIIADFDQEKAAINDRIEKDMENIDGETGEVKKGTTKGGKGRKGRRVAADSTKAVAVGRSAGG